MRYAETAPPTRLEGFVAAAWTLEVAENGWVDHEAVPDGCIEVIRRHRGRSIWRDEQPAFFVTGLALRPARLRFSGDARFSAVRLWPWAWNALGGFACASFTDSWRAIRPDDPIAALFPDGGDPLARLAAVFDDVPIPPVAAVRYVDSVGALVRRTGMTPRQVQRIFARETGMPPRSYLRLLRFRDAVAGVQADDACLADMAAAAGYADQAHMTREFRSLAGVSPGDARRRAKGPFI